MTARTLPRSVLDAKPLPDGALTDRFIDFFWSRVETAGECWNWTGNTSASGYGTVRVPGDRNYFRAHRVSYLVAKGEPPVGYVIDHRCFNRLCVNPDHLRAMEHYANMARRDPRKDVPRDHCSKGHEFSPENTYVTPGGHRQCRACNKEAVQRYRTRIAESGSAA
jgi:hypothetical protein